MRRRTFTVVTGGLVLWGTGCGVRFVPPEERGTGGSQTLPAEEISRIAVEQAFAEVQAGRAVLVDVRSAEAYRRSRGAGAILLPLEQVEQDPRAAVRALPEGKRPILYCT
jgi:hypothetical protein